MPRLRPPTLPMLGAAALCFAVACGGSSKQSETETLPPAHNEESWEAEETPRPEASEPAQPESDIYEPTPAAEGDVSEDEVETFARAYLEVVNIQQAYGSKIQSAGSQDEVQALQVEAKTEMEQAISDEGMTMNEFEELGEALNTDDELRRRVETKLQELQTNAAPE